ncbi:MAG TPA: cupin domain-containing protein [Flexivirga sp.]|uniref:helix-turn-helix domain-containing protein n=1 Tax=Flexivirga sp. TaxID=1962927 RepID=UPI002BFB6F32|nr:cupin domain-containing protein [Flexivirga sp.]HWC24578.1 cupin domain-containing protein [Flexivirga sp.]
MADQHSDGEPGRPAADGEEVTPGIGDRIRAIRQSRDLSIRELAALAGVSTGLISQVERGINDPSLQTARAIAKALQTPLFDFFQDPDRSELAVVRADRRMSLRSPHGDLTYERISPGSGSLEMLEGRLEPHSASSEDAWSHPSEECVVVTAGSLTVEVDGVAQYLATGDSCYFNSRYPHRYVNDTDEPVRFVLAITPPSY